MNSSHRLVSSLLAMVIGLTALSHLVAEDTPDFPAAKKLMQDGNYKEALAAFRKNTLSNKSDTDAQFRQAQSRQIVEAFNDALRCYRELNQTHEIDAYREAVAKQHEEDWRVLAAVAESYRWVEHSGYTIAGEFRRGPHRGGGKRVHVQQRDRVRRLQLYGDAFKRLKASAEAEKLAQQEALNFLHQYTQAVLPPARWQMQLLTDLEKLPDFGEGYSHYYGSNSGATVDADGTPIYYDEPASWESAKNDGERWRWLLAERVRWAPRTEADVLVERAQFLQSQFGVQTMARYDWFGRGQDADAVKGTYALHTLKENETIAQLATGVKRFELPEEHNHIALYRRAMELASEKKAGTYSNAATQLANIFLNRRQYPQAAKLFKLVSELPQTQANSGAHRQYEQIVKPWGRLGSTVTQPAGRGAVLQYRFRNGEQVEFTAKRVKVRELLNDLKTSIKQQQTGKDRFPVNINRLGYDLFEKGQDKYLGEEVARWQVPLQPRENHFDSLEAITTPLQKAGAYFVTAKMRGGNEQRILVWLADTAIIKKPLDGKELYYVADAVTGKPLPKMNLEFFGWRHERRRDILDRKIAIDQFAEATNDDGFVQIDSSSGSMGYKGNEYALRRNRWLVTATDTTNSEKGGRFAYLGWGQVWRSEYRDQAYKQVKVFTVTDRPVYRPGHKVQFKFWVRNAQYDKDTEGGKKDGVEQPSRFANQSFQIEIRNPKREKVYTGTATADAYGGLSGEWTLPDDATLGSYNLMVVNHGGGFFRVEEYKKPEYEVTIDAPEKPISLGEKVTAKVNAKYYFGSPVTSATVKLKVTRSDYNQQWYPESRWDWLYGRGYWWFTPDYHWYPGWSRWGCGRPWPWWVWRQPTPPEVVLEQTAKIGEDGTVEVEIDTALAKEFHSDTDHRYEITAEVVDESRRTVVAKGEVLVARQPFQVFLWAHRGFYRSGDTIEVSAAARTLDGKPVSGEGKLRLLRIAYEEGKPVENEVATWDLASDEQGRASLQIAASEPGQYRLAYEVTNTDGKSNVGAQILTIRGDNFDSGDFQFNDIEIVANKRDYALGEEVELQISTNKAGAAVLLFLRPSNGVYLPPKLIKIRGKSSVVKVPVTAKDMPNFFVEAVTVHGGRMHETVREIYVPPADRVINVEVVPSAETYKPGQKAKVQLKLTDENGNAFIGSTVLAVYDKSLEYISGGTNVPEIKEFFWKWRRSHRSTSQTNLGQYQSPIVKRDEIQMDNLGVFGESVVDLELINDAYAAGKGGGGYGGRVPLGQAVQRSKGMLEARGLSARAAPAMVDGLSEVSEGAGSGSQLDPPMVEPTVRKNFADTAFWNAALETNSDGLAEVEFDMPENLTAWKVAVWGMGHGTRVGQSSAEVVTRKNFILRLQAPRFFIQKDEVVLSANVHNYLSESKQVRVKLELEGGVLEGPKGLVKNIEIPADGEKRVDWRVKVIGEGTAVVRMSALTDEESDAMQMSFPAYVHGMLKTESFTGIIKPDENGGEFTFTVPAERRPEQTRFELRYTPTLAGAMVDALPYLADYPYGCTEQTLNRFLPTVLTQQTLIRMGVDLADIEKKRTNLNAQEIGDDEERAKGWKRFDRNPVFDDAELTTMVKAGVNRLTEMQLSDGGWGWFSGWGEHSSPHTTATVVRGLLVAQRNDVVIVPGVIDRGVQWLERYQQQELAKLDNWDREKDKARDREKAAKRRADNLDALVYLVLAENKKKNARMRDYLYQDRTTLAVYSKAVFGLALKLQGEEEKLAMVMRNLSQYVKQDDENQTAWLDLPGGYWWYWYGSEYEAQAYYLKLLVAENPESEVAPRLVKYLLNNRKHATYWNSTRDTALVVEAFADYLSATKEGQGEVEIEVLINGELKKTVTINSENLFTFDNKLVLEGEGLETGRHTVQFRKRGEGPIYWNGYLTNFTLEDPIEAAGLEVKVKRNYYKLVPVKKEIDVAGNRGQAVSQRVEKYDRQPIVNLEELSSGDLVEVELVIESKNDYEYLMLEDRKPAGCESVEVRSGYNGNDLGAYVEYRDDRVNLFVRRLARGKHSVSYRLRAEIPGKFSALPTEVSAMYAPELKANSDEFKLRIAD